MYPALKENHASIRKERLLCRSLATFRCAGVAVWQFRGVLAACAGKAYDILVYQGSAEF
jgi:hypothetical protein